MMYVHTLFIGLVVFLMGMLCISSADELLHTALGKKILFGLSLFWLTRLGVQFFGFSPLLWRGKRFETAMHILFSLIWIFLSAVFVTASLQ